MIYFDTTCLLQLYLDGDGSAAIRERATTAPLACASLGRAELVASFHRAMADGAFGTRAYAELCRQFETDNREGAFTWLPLGEAELAFVEKTIARLPAGFPLPASHAIHLATAKLNGFREIHTVDEGMIRAAPRFDLRAVNLTV